MEQPADSFPRQTARTRNFTLGAPRTFRVASDGSRVVFLRSPAGDDPQNGLWVLDPAAGTERLVAGAGAAGTGPGDGDGDGDGEALPEAEKARRERTRETGGGIVAYDADEACTMAVVAAGGDLVLIDLAGAAGPAVLPARPGAFDPRLSPAGERVAYVSGNSLRVIERDGSDRLVAGEDDPDVSWGSAEFVAAEEMGRTRGHWWAPDGRRLAAARVDNRRVGTWHVSDPTHPATPPATLRYPAAGTENAGVSLAIVGLDGSHIPVPWDRERFPYLVTVRWDDAGLLVTVQSRDQRSIEVLAVDPETGTSTTLAALADPVWVDIVEGTPAWLAGALVTASDRIWLDGKALTPEGLHVRRVASVDGASASILFTASEDDPTVVDVYRAGPGGVERMTGGRGVHEVLAAGGDVAVIARRSLDQDGASVEVWKAGVMVASVASNASKPLVTPAVSLSVLGGRRLRTALLVPSQSASGGPWPVLMDPYGGPHHQRVMASRSNFLTSQWLADQGFAVVVIDGRGTPGRGPEWERSVRGDLAGPVLEDQVEALHDLAESDGRLDLGRVAIRGWSFGGYLAALAVLRRPDVFHAAIAGAPVTDWALYDTHYTERYLGHPDEAPEAYRRSSIVDDARRLERPLLLIHGFLDDNVVAAHSVRLSAALVGAGRPHQFLPLPGATHLTRDESVAENLLKLQVDFLRRSLGVPAG